MNCRLDHIALNCKDLNEPARFYEKHFGGKPTPLRMGGDGRNFCFMNTRRRGYAID
jgi:glyoxalase/bleomycin resistance protein/dioxygenase superfamily protein